MRGDELQVGLGPIRALRSQEGFPLKAIRSHLLSSKGKPLSVLNDLSSCSLESGLKERGGESQETEGPGKTG